MESVLDVEAAGAGDRKASPATKSFDHFRGNVIGNDVVGVAGGKGYMASLGLYFQHRMHGTHRK